MTYNTLKRCTIIKNVKRHQLILPKTQRFHIMKLHQNHDGHFGINIIYKRISIYYY